MNRKERQTATYPLFSVFTALSFTVPDSHLGQMTAFPVCMCIGDRRSPQISTAAAATELRSVRTVPDASLPFPSLPVLPSRPWFRLRTDAAYRQVYEDRDHRLVVNKTTARHPLICSSCDRPRASKFVKLSFFRAAVEVHLRKLHVEPFRHNRARACMT